jgi:hypothetical protein
MIRPLLIRFVCGILAVLVGAQGAAVGVTGGFASKNTHPASCAFFNPDQEYPIYYGPPGQQTRYQTSLCQGLPSIVLKNHILANSPADFITGFHACSNGRISSANNPTLFGLNCMLTV